VATGAVLRVGFGDLAGAPLLGGGEGRQAEGEQQAGGDGTTGVSGGFHRWKSEVWGGGGRDTFHENSRTSSDDTKTLSRRVLI
jgi:hypothetical protein